MDLHICGKNGFDQETTQVRVVESNALIPAEDLRICGTVESLKNGTIVIQLGEGGLECDEESIIDTWMPDIMPDGCDHECQRVERP